MGALVFTEESFGDALLAHALWAFAVPSMPTECRAVCWGVQDPAVLVLLSRALPAKKITNGTRDLDGEGPLLWPLQAYLGPPKEDFEVSNHAVEVLGARVADPTPGEGDLGSGQEQTLS